MTDRETIKGSQPRSSDFAVGHIQAAQVGQPCQGRKRIVCDAHIVSQGQGGQGWNGGENGSAGVGHSPTADFQRLQRLQMPGNTFHIWY